jgi:uncharacterized cupin superfamily protein
VKPIMNLDQVTFDDVEENGIYTSSRGQISDHIGARKLGYNLTVLPPGGPEVAHQIINTGATTMRYLALSTVVDVEACEYPDSRKVLVVAGERGRRGLRKIFRADNTVDYYDGENPD